ncbi:uncharacterized protein LOC128026526 isoform X3 [Carassius gibelio]|uniref:uncharacterized protein LOC128026526 isoform X3 n=1 Tax=Carassius gibelio TaxID=101364 RepID=UPI002277F5CC|nr:uncharacterized protein LOC128026526 isoform X3 [Carassius gibelio]
MFLFPGLLHNCVVFISVVLSQTHAEMEDQPAGVVSEVITTVTGGSKPVHRFLRGQPKSIGFFICGLLYILSERNPSKKIITASLALNIISIIGVLIALLEFSRVIVEINSIVEGHYEGYYEGQMYENQTGMEKLYARQHYMFVRDMELVFCCHSVIGGVLLVTMSFFARAALKSSRTQAFFVMRNLPSVE